MVRLLSRLPHRLALASLLALSLLLSACGPTDSTRVTDYRSQGELRVATRHDAISYRIDDEGHASGFEHELLLALGDTLGVPVRFVPYPDAARALDAVINGQVHMAAAGLGQNERLPLRWSAPLREVEYVIVGRNDGPAVNTEDRLAGRTVSVRRGSLPAERVSAIRKRLPALNVHFPIKTGEEKLLADLARGALDLVATDRLHYAFAARIHPELEIVYELPGRSSIAWALAPEDEGLATEVDAFIAAFSASG